MNFLVFSSSPWLLEDSTRDADDWITDEQVHDNDRHDDDEENEEEYGDDLLLRPFNLPVHQRVEEIVAVDLAHRHHANLVGRKEGGYGRMLTSHMTEKGVNGYERGLKGGQPPTWLKKQKAMVGPLM